MISSRSKILIVIIAIIVALLHFVFGPDYQGPLKDFVRSYLIDIVLPMSMYLLTQLALRKKLSLLSSRLLGSLSVFIFGVIVELSQFYGIPFFGNTYDYVDIVMYALGVGLGLVIDLFIISYFDRKNMES